jgi:6-pyruvoyltetrahydropterin/6-carboxytetrahydropterin synthase
MAHSLHLRRTFCAAHRIWNDDSPCRHIHGHNYRVKVQIVVPSGYQLSDEGFIVPWAAVKAKIDAYDHRLLLHVEDPAINDLLASGLDFSTVELMPSTENLARLIAEDIAALMPRDTMIHLRLRETDSIEATWSTSGCRV